MWIYTQLIFVEDNFLQYIYNFAVRSTTFSFIYLTSNKICTTCLSNKPLIDLFTQLLTCRHQGCFAIYDVLFTCLTYGSFYNLPTKYTTSHWLSTTSSMKYRTSTFSSFLLSIWKFVMIDWFTKSQHSLRDFVFEHVQNDGGRSLDYGIQYGMVQSSPKPSHHIAIDENRKIRNRRPCL